MKAGKKYIKDNIECFMCPFEEMYITQGSMSNFSHKGIMANDVRGKEIGQRYPYYAPCTCKCLWVYEPSGQSMWQSVEKVLFANGNIDYATFMIAHDNTQNCYVGQIISQGVQIGNMGDKGQATGVHCHIQVEQGDDNRWYKNEYGIYHFNNEADLDDCYFINDTNILNGSGGDWKEASFNEISQDEELLLLVKRAIRGDFGNGMNRQLLLGSKYNDVQYQVQQNYENNTTSWDSIRLY